MANQINSVQNSTEAGARRAELLIPSIEEPNHEEKNMIQIPKIEVALQPLNTAKVFPSSRILLNASARFFRNAKKMHDWISLMGKDDPVMVGDLDVKIEFQSEVSRFSP